MTTTFVLCCIAIAFITGVIVGLTLRRPNE